MTSVSLLRVFDDPAEPSGMKSIKYLLMIECDHCKMVAR